MGETDAHKHRSPHSCLDSGTFLCKNNEKWKLNHVPPILTYPDNILVTEVTLPPPPEQIGHVLPKILELGVQDIGLAVVESIPKNNAQNG